MYDFDDYNPCEECDEDPDTCNCDPAECLAANIEHLKESARDAYD
jgi:hypothetical protein